MGRGSVTLSSIKAEYVSFSELAKKILFVKQVSKEMGIELEYLTVIEVCNVGAIYMANKNHSTSQRTKYVDTRSFCENYVKDEILKVVLVRLEDNDADIFTKNTIVELFLKHRCKLFRKGGFKS